MRLYPEMFNPGFVNELIIMMHSSAEAESEQSCFRSEAQREENDAEMRLKVPGRDQRSINMILYQAWTASEKTARQHSKTRLEHHEL